MNATLPEPVVRARLAPTGVPIGAEGQVVIHAAPQRVWAAVSDIAAYPRHVPMMQRVALRGDRVKVELGFKMAFVSVGFDFEAAVARDPERRIDLRWLAGEPRGIHLAFELLPAEQEGTCPLRVEATFEPQSLGWLAKYFLRHHPEIQFGIFPGVVLALLDAMRRAST